MKSTIEPTLPRWSNEEGAYAASINDALHRAECTPLSRDDEHEAFMYYREHQDQATRDRLILANIRFVSRFVKDHHIKPHMEADALSEGIVGLVIAVDRFDPDKGYKFITYAVWWIRQRVYAFLYTQRQIVRKPNNWQKSIAKIYAAREALIECQESVTIYDIAQKVDMPEEEVHMLLVSYKADTSLDVPVDETGWPWSTQTMLHFTASDAEPQDDRLHVEQWKEVIASSLDQLEDPRDRRVLREYFGFNGIEYQTLEAIGATMNLTRERIRQIKERALGRLRRQAMATLADCYHALPECDTTHAY
jgi:RNA polymerase sigma factor (sigma-70 family)